MIWLSCGNFPRAVQQQEQARAAVAAQRKAQTARQLALDPTVQADVRRSGEILITPGVGKAVTQNTQPAHYSTEMFRADPRRAEIAAERKEQAQLDSFHLPINQKAAEMGREIVVTPGALKDVVQSVQSYEYKYADFLADALEDLVDKNEPNPVVVKLIEDLRKFDINNQSEGVVLDSNYFSAYKGVPIVRIDQKHGSSFSFGFVGLDKKYADANTVKHEYGHTVQLDERGLFGYLLGVAVPSLINNYLERKGKTDNYYGAPWEAEADKYGSVQRNSDNTPWADEWYIAYDAYSNYIVPLIEILSTVLPYI